MEIGNQQNFSATPLTSISPRQVNPDAVPSERSSQNEDGEQQKNNQNINQQNARVIRQLKSRDREVRAHESAHVAAGGQYVKGGPSYTFQRGPDGRSYAIGGEVSIDASKVANDPEATLAKAGIVRRAALAPAQPSSQDLSVASRANQTAAQARVEIAVLRAEQATQNLQDQSEAVGQLAEDSEAESTSSSANTDGGSEVAASATNTDSLSSIQSFKSEEARTVSFSLFA